MQSARQHAQWVGRLLGVLVVVVCGVFPAAGAAQGNTGASQTDDRQKARELTEPPKLVEEVKATYTDRALEEGVEGAVQLKIRITKKGNVDRVEVVEGLGYGLDESAVEAVKQFKFKPAEIDGKPAAVVLNFKVRFSLPKRPATLRGRVLTADNGRGLEGVVVEVEYLGDDSVTSSEARATTDSEGRFVFEELPAGPYRVAVEPPSFRPSESRIELSSGETVDIQFSVEAKPVRLSGVVKEAGTRDPIAGAEVVIRDPESGEVERRLYTKEGGRFAVRGLESGDWTVDVRAQGYRPEKFEETVRDDETTQVTYYIRAEYYDDFSVSTTAKREQESISRKTIQLEEIRRIPGTANDAVRAVQNLPGVARPAFGGGQIIARGSTPNSTATFLEGDEIPLIYHFLGGPAVISSEMIKAVDFYPGNYRARYGRALAGIVNLQTREPKTDRFHGFAEIDALDVTAQVEGPISDEVSFAASARRSYIDAILPAVLPEDSVDLGVAPRYYDFQAWLNWDPNDNHTLKWFVYGSDDRFEVLFDEDEPQGNAQVQSTSLNLNNSFYRGQFQWEWRPDSGEVENDFMGSFGVNDFGFRAASNLFFQLQFNQFQFRNDFRWDFSEKANFNAGLDIQAGWADFSAQFPRSSEGAGGSPGPNVGESGAVARGQDSTVYYPAVYAELELMPVEGLKIIPGARVDYYNNVDEFAASPRLNARYAISDMVTVKGGVGLFNQPPNPGATDDTFGNPDLTYEEATQYSAGVEIEPLDYLTIDTTLFFQSLDDLVRNTDRVTVDESSGEAEPLVFDNRGEGRAWGWELLIRHAPANKFFGWLAYTLSWSQRRNEGQSEWEPFEFDQRHNLTLVAGYNLPWNIDISARFRVVSGNPRTPVVDSVYDADSNDYLPVNGATNSVRESPFHQLDLRIDKTFVFNTWKLGIYLDIINVYNATNPEGRQYNYDYTESAPLRGLPIIPTLGINARF